MSKELIAKWVEAGEIIKLVNTNYYKELQKELGGVEVTQEVFLAYGVFFVKDVRYDSI